MSLKSTTRYGIAVDNGHFQAQKIDFAENGHATVTPLSGWVTMKQAESVIRPLGWIPYRERFAAK